MWERERGLWPTVMVLAAWTAAGCSTHAVGNDGAAPDGSASDQATASEGGDAPDIGGAEAAPDAGAADAADLGGIIGMPVATFDATEEGFALSTYNDAGNLAILPAGANPATLAESTTQGSPTAGCLEVTAPFSGANQYVAAEGVIDAHGLRDWTGRTAHVRVRVASGTFSGTATLYVDTTLAYVYGGNSGAGVPSDGAWHELTLDVSHPPVSPAPSTYDPSKVILVGVRLDTGPAGADATPVVFDIDSFSIDPPEGPADGGATPDADASAATDAAMLGPIAGTPFATFDSTLEGFVLNDATSGLTQAATLDEDTTEGSPTPGCLRVGAPFSDANQNVVVQKTLAQPQDWSGDILHVRARVASGAFSGGVELLVSTTSSAAYGGGVVSLPANGAWHDLTLNVSQPATLRASGYDPTQVTLVAVAFLTTNAGVGATPVVFDVDSFSIESAAAAPDAATD